MQIDPSKSDPPERKRRRFQFSLRTLIIVITLLVCGYVAWQAKIVRERQTWQARWSENEFGSQNRDRLVSWGDSSQSPNFVRRWLGDSAKDIIVLPPTVSDEDKQTTLRLFPESLVVQMWKAP